MLRVLSYTLGCVCLLSVSCQGLMQGLLPLTAVGLAGLKLYLGMHLLGMGASMVGRQLHGTLVPDQNEDDSVVFTTTNSPEEKPPATEKTARKKRSSAKSAERVKRTNELPKLNAEMLQFIHEIDDDQCFERFFCQIGADRAAFGSFGTNTALLLDFYIPDKTAWYAKALAQGRELRNKELCPGKCRSEDIQKAVKYVSKHLFDGT